MGEANIPATAFPIRAMRGSRPGLPRESQWRAEQRRQQRVQLFVVGERQQWGVLEFQRDEPQSQQREQPRLRSSVALPLSVYRRSSAEQGGAGCAFFPVLSVGGVGTVSCRLFRSIGRLRWFVSEDDKFSNLLMLCGISYGYDLLFRSAGEEVIGNSYGSATVLVARPGLPQSCGWRAA